MQQPRWTFLTSHGLVVMIVAQRPDATVRQLAELVGLTERQVHRVLAELEEAGFIRRERVGRRNRYTIDRTRELPDPVDIEVGDLLGALDVNGPGRTKTRLLIHDF